MAIEVLVYNIFHPSRGQDGSQFHQWSAHVDILLRHTASVGDGPYLWLDNFDRGSTHACL